MNEPRVEQTSQDIKSQTYLDAGCKVPEDQDCGMASHSIVRPLANRSLHMVITPRPANLAESREILRLISHFGEVEMFKSLKYESLSAPNTVLTIFKEEDAAKQCLRRSPLRFTMGRNQQPRTGTDDVERNALPTAIPPPTDALSGISPLQPAANLPAGHMGAPFGLQQSRNMSTRSTQPPSEQEDRIFQIQVNTSRFNHRDQINVGIFHGPFHIDSKSAAQEDLAKRVPLVGQSDIRLQTENKPWRLMMKDREREVGKDGKKRVTLKSMWEEGSLSGQHVGTGV